MFFSRGGKREAKGEESCSSGAPSPPLCAAVLFFFPAALQAADGKKSLHEVTRAERDFCKTHFHGLTISVHKPIWGGGGGAEGGGTNSSCAKSNYTQWCNVTAHKRLSVHPAVAGGGREKKTELHAVKISVRQQLGRR